MTRCPAVPLCCPTTLSRENIGWDTFSVPNAAKGQVRAGVPLSPPYGRRCRWDTSLHVWVTRP